MRDPVRIILLITLCVAVGTLPFCATAGSGASYSIDWGTVTGSPSPARALETADMGKCICDLYRDACDPNCCCDVDCSSDEKELFVACEQEVVSGAELVDCYTASSASTEIYRGRYEAAEDYHIPGETGVCIYRENTRDLAQYFKVPRDLKLTTAHAVKNKDWYAEMHREETFFDVTAPIPEVVAVEKATREWVQIRKGSGYLTIPTPSSFNGRCQDGKWLRFMTPSAHTSCFRSATSFETLCSILSLENFKNRGLKTPGAITTESSTSVVGITLYVHDAETGALIATYDPNPVFSGIFNQGGRVEGVEAREEEILSGRDRSTTQTLKNEVNSKQRIESTEHETNRRHFLQQGTVSTEAVDGVCRNAVVRAETLVGYKVTNGKGKILNATTTIFVRDLTLADVSKDNSSTLLAQQSFLFAFDKHITSLGEPDLRAGQTGYRAGGMILAGTLASNGGKKAIQRRVSGLTVTSGGACVNAADHQRPVRFLHNVENSGCSVDVTEQQLQDICGSDGGTYDLMMSLFSNSKSTFGVGSGLNNTLTWVSHLGLTGDTHYEDINGWIAISGMDELEPAQMAYDQEKRQCDNLMVGLHYTIVIGRAGAEYNPQDVILAARVDPILGAWRFTGDSQNPSSTSQNFFKFRVSFKRNDEFATATIRRRVIPPPILEEMDDNIFYPFRVSGRPSKHYKRTET